MSYEVPRTSIVTGFESIHSVPPEQSSNKWGRGAEGLWRRGQVRRNSNRSNQNDSFDCTLDISATCQTSMLHHAPSNRSKSAPAPSALVKLGVPVAFTDFTGWEPCTGRLTDLKHGEILSTKRISAMRLLPFQAATNLFTHRPTWQHDVWVKEPIIVMSIDIRSMDEEAPRASFDLVGTLKKKTAQLETGKI